MLASHAPDHGVRDLVEAGDAEQGERLEQRDAQRPVLEKAERQPAGARKGGQQQRVEPHRETRRRGRRARRDACRHFQKMPPSAAGANCATAANEIRPIDTSAYASPATRKYRYPSSSSATMAPRRMPSSRPRQVRLLVQAQRAQAQQHRHHQVVADHGGERDGLDDHHAGRGRQPADEHQRAPAAPAFPPSAASARRCRRPRRRRGSAAGRRRRSAARTG